MTNSSISEGTPTRPYARIARRVASLAILAAGSVVCYQVGSVFVSYVFSNGPHPFDAALQLCCGSESTFLRIDQMSGFNAVSSLISFLTALGIFCAMLSTVFHLSVESSKFVGMGRKRYKAHKKAERRSVPKAVELGTLVSVTVNTGGFFSPTTTTITTTQGFYIVYGRTGPLHAGSTVRQIGTDLAFDHGKGNTQRYRLCDG